MPETARGIWYPESGAPADVPTDMEKLAEGVDGLLGEVGLDQLVATEEDDGKLVIVKDGAAAYKAMSGDVTISEDGVATIGTGKVGTTELADLGVSTGKVNNKAITLGKLAEALGLTEGYYADGSVTSRKAKLKSGVISATGDKELTEAYVDIPGAVLEITPAVASILKVTAVFDLGGLGQDGDGRLDLHGTIRVDAEDQSALARLKFDFTSGEEARGTVVQVYSVPLTAAAHVIKLRAKRATGGDASCDSDGTRFLYELIAS